METLTGLNKNPHSDVPYIQMKNIWKRFPGDVVANQGINLDLYKGEVHALLGENGAGKSTLMNILAGIYRPDAGEIVIDGKKVDIRTPRSATDLGIGMVHQHFKLVDNLTVAENISLGWDETPWHTSREGLAARLETVASGLGFSIDPKAEVWQLSVGEQQRAEILHVMSRGAQVIIMDEPTAVLTPIESEELFSAMREMVSRGQIVVFISHKLTEVLEVSDRVTVLRRGKNADSRLISECDRQVLADMMVGRKFSFKTPVKKMVNRSTVLEITNIEAQNDRELPALRGVDLKVKRGEILGIAGVSGNGQKELAEVLTGLRPVQKGKIVLEGKNLTGSPPILFAEAGIGHIPGDRKDMGLFQWEDLTHNAILREYRNPPIRKGIWLMWKVAEQFTKELIKKADIRAHYEVPVGILSGGNQQKLLVHREIGLATSLLVTSSPTRGLDVAATEEVRTALLTHKERGCAVILISEDLDEILLMSDRIAVMFEGKIMGVLTANEATSERIGLMMGGVLELEEKARE
jgi:ABC-type uncharacterized transport system ATPase subunit